MYMYIYGAFYDICIYINSDTKIVFIVFGIDVEAAAALVVIIIIITIFIIIIIIININTYV